jgi:hypothetical protein
METVLRIRDRIYDHIQNTATCQWITRSTHTEYIGYCISMDTIQDTAEVSYTSASRVLVEYVCEVF